MGFTNMHEVLRAGAASFTPTVFAEQNIREVIETALDESDAWHRRFCTLQAPLVMSAVLAMSLFRSSSIANVFKRVLDAIRGTEDVGLTDVTSEAFYKARGRLGSEPLRHLALALGERAEPAPTFFDFIPCAIDGVTMDVPDTPENEVEFGRQAGSRGDAAFPQMKGVGLIYTATHTFVDCVWGRHDASELDGAERLVHHLDSRHVVFLDRRYTKVDLWFSILDTGAHMVHRLSASYKVQKIRQLGEGDWLVRVDRWVRLPREPGRRNCKRRLESRTLRLVQYRVGQNETVQLITDLLDPTRYPALELALGYHNRWEIELVLDEGKTHLHTVGHGTQHTVFRSQKPAGVYQEAWAMLAAYNLIRALMVASGKRHNVPPIEISFVETVEVIRLALPVFERVGTRQRTKLYDRLLRDIAACRLRRPRRKRWAPRVVKRKMSNFKLKRAAHASVPYDYAAELRLVAR